MFENYQRKILNYLNNKKSASFLDIVKFLNINPKYNRAFSDYLFQLKLNGTIAFSKKRNQYFIPKFIGNYDVDFKITSQGKFFAFAKLNDTLEVKVIIFNNHLNALKDDNININVYQDIDDLDFYFATEIKINCRKNKYIYAEIDSNLNLKIISNNINNYQIIYDKSSLEKNTYARFKINKIEQNNIYLSIDKILEPTSKPYSDIDLLVDISGVKTTFSDEVLEEAKLIPDQVEITNTFNRVDLTSKLIVTIDGEKTKDFDDAIFVEKNEEDYILYVSIADVAYYVQEDSQIDIEARNRGCSIYLIDKVIPMLPEKLSNGICSLNPNENRYAITLEAKIDKQGRIINKKIYPSIIKSKYRLTYNQVANKENDEAIKKDLELSKMLIIAYELSDIIGNNKRQEGYIDFEIEESIIELDKITGEAIAIKKRERLSSEILIENFMIFANEVVSKMIADLKIPSIYRVHESPSLEKVQNLNSFISSIFPKDHYQLQSSNNPKDFQKFVNQIKEKRFDNLVKMFLLKTMQKAKYSSNNIGHFGLASKYYSHFTSPIRRYPDLLLHRIIWEVIFKKNNHYSEKKNHEIDQIALSSSNAEIIAVDIERKVIDMKKAEYYEKFVDNKEIIATIVSIQKFGFFVDLGDTSNALVHISTLEDFENYKVSDDYYSLYNESKNKVFKIGQKVTIKIDSVSKLEGKINAFVVEK